MLTAKFGSIWPSWVRWAKKWRQLFYFGITELGLYMSQSLSGGDIKITWTQTVHEWQGEHISKVTPRCNLLLQFDFCSLFHWSHLILILLLTCSMNHPQPKNTLYQKMNNKHTITPGMGQTFLEKLTLYCLYFNNTLSSSMIHLRPHSIELQFLNSFLQLKLYTVEQPNSNKRLPLIIRSNNLIHWKYKKCMC